MGSQTEYGKKIRKEIINRLKPHDTVIKEGIKVTINDLRVKIGATRVGLWQFTNGVYSQAGYGMKFLEMIMESPAQGFASIKQNFKRMPYEDVMDLVGVIRDADKYWVGKPDTDIIEARTVYEIYSIRTAVEFKLKNSDIYKGFLSITFNHDIEVTPEMLKTIESSANQVYSLIRKLKK